MKLPVIFQRSPKALAAYLAVLVALVQTPQLADAAVDSGSIRIELKDNLLTLEARDASLVKVLGQIGELADFRVIVIDNYRDIDSVTLALRAVPVEKAIERLVRGTNNIIFHLPDKNRISQVWLLDRSSSTQEDSPLALDDRLTNDNESGNSGRRGKSVLRLANRAGTAGADQGTFTQIRTTLIDILATDRDNLVRARAAMALGKLGDDEAVDALEAASMDASTTVVAQSINALGQIDSIRAINALGGILLDADRPATARVIAAQALWKQDSDLAREFLGIAAADDNRQVRNAAGKPPPSPTGRALPSQRGQSDYE